MENCLLHSASKDRLSLALALVVATAVRLRELLQREDGVGKGDDYFVHHMYQSDFEIACDLLWRSGISYGAWYAGRGPAHLTWAGSKEDEKSKKLGFPPFFAIPDAFKAKELFDQFDAEKLPRIELLIDAYLRVATDYGRNSAAHLPTKRSELFFPTHPDQEPVLEAFTRCGYARKVGTQYVWTDQMLPMMAEIWLWSEKDLNSALVDQDKMVEEATRILDSFNLDDSDSQRENLRCRSIPFRALEIQYLWDGQAWLPHRREAPRLTFDEALVVSLLLEDELG